MFLCKTYFVLTLVDMETFRRYLVVGLSTGYGRSALRLIVLFYAVSVSVFVVVRIIIKAT
jgi:hypothetical protein